MGGHASPQVIGRYAVYGKLASGGMASVHFGRLLGGAGFSRTVAIKRLHPHLAEDPEFLSTMIDEARLAARITHPNVVPTLDVVAAEGELLLVMEYVRGESLARLLRADIAHGSRVPLSVASAVAVGTLHGLHAAHEATTDRGEALAIVHRDVSPQNILVGTDGVARVIDFGVAKAAGRLQTTRDGVIKGKIAYMAPEQLTAREVTRAADVYAMGVVLWEMLANRRLFQADNEAILMGLVLAGATEPPSRYAGDLPPGVDDLVMKALAIDPRQRFATALEMAEALMRILPPAFPTEVGKWCQRGAVESLAKRGSMLAEIESTSGFAPVMAPAAPPSGEELPALGSQRSQASSLSIAGTVPPPHDARRRLMLAASVGGGALVGLGLVAVFVMHVTAVPAQAPDESMVAAAPSPTQASAPAPSPAPAPSAAPASSAAPAPSPAPSPAPAPSLAPAAGPAPSLAAAREPAPSPAPEPSPAPATAAPPQPPAARLSAAPPAPKVSCNPPYEFDSAGHKIWKRQCL